jgi:hypothetical protein
MMTAINAIAGNGAHGTVRRAAIASVGAPPILSK